MFRDVFFRSSMQKLDPLGLLKCARGASRSWRFRRLLGFLVIVHLERTGGVQVQRCCLRSITESTRCWAVEPERTRTHSVVFPSGPSATNAKRDPSGEIAKL